MLQRSVFVLFVVAPILFGQATDSIIVGTVADASLAAVAGATVTAKNKDTNVKYDTVTNVEGLYRLNNIPVGRYDVSAAAPGFSMATMGDVQTDLNRTATVNLSLAVGSVTTQVDVQEAAAAIDTTTSQLQGTYGSQAALDMPTAGISKVVNGAGIYNISLNFAGVALAGGIGLGTGPSVAGQRSENNTFSIDGVDNNDHDVTGPVVYVSNDAVSQFSVLQNQFSPEFGGASGGVFNVIVKSGTNQIHGSVYDYLQNRNLNAVDNSEALQGLRSNPRFDSNRLGATIGGPIKRDKLFYFGNFEYNPLGQATAPGQTVYAPTAAGLSLLNNMSGLNKTNLGVFQKYVPVAPAADPTNPITVNGISIPNGPLSFAAPNFDNNYNAIVAIDWNISNTDQLRGRYIYNKTTGVDINAALPVFYGPEPILNHMISLSEFHNFSPTMENELRLSYMRHNQQVPPGSFTFPGLNTFPNLTIDELGSLQIGPDPNAPSGGIQNLSQFQEAVTKTWGRHTFKAGYNFTDVILSSFFVQRVRGDYEYSSLELFLTDTQPDVFGERTFGATTGVPEGFLQHAAYFNDDFRVRSNLTLNLGLRYEYVTVPVASRAQQYSAIADLPGNIQFNNPKTSKNDWSPRVGFAYSPGTSGKWSIRGGFGRSFDLPYANLSVNANPAFYQVTRDVNLSNPVSNFLANGGLTYTPQAAPTAAQARQPLSSYTWDQNRPYALNGTLGVQRLLGKDYTLEARYVYTKGVHLYVQDRLNTVSPLSSGLYIPTYFTMPSAAQFAGLTTTLGQVKSTLLPGTTATEPWNNLSAAGFQSAITGFNPYGNSRYNGLALQLTKRFSQNFSGIVAYTWSHNQDDSTATVFSTYLTPRRAQDPRNPGADWSDSALDRRQRLTISPVYDLKFFQNRNWVMKNLVSNWSLLGTYTYQSGEMATVQSGLDSNLNNDSAGDRAIINPAGIANTGTGVTAYNAAGQMVSPGDAGIVAYVANNPNARYVVAQSGARANGGRNTIQLPGINNFDVSIIKRFALRESKRFELSGQFVNLFNHAQYTGSWINDVSPNPTLATTRNELIPSNAQFAQWSQFFPSNSRTIQLVARFVF